MPRRSTDTRGEIRAVALELFAANGFEKTSLREIAERLDISKAALYYHFSSKDELLTELAQPMVADLEGFLEKAEAVGRDRPRELLELYFDLCHRHQMLFQGLLRDPAVMARLGVIPTLIHRRTEIDRVLVGSDAPADLVRAVIAFGGLQDCVVLMVGVPVESIRAAAVDAAMRALLPG